jgi:transcriptional regulator with XRE-family HTH domain
MEPDSEYLKNIRLDLGLSQKKLAEYLGYSRIYIALIETGKRPLSKNIEAQLDLFFDNFDRKVTT